MYSTVLMSTQWQFISFLYNRISSPQSITLDVTLEILTAGLFKIKAHY